jgi:hypothetical protein
MYFRCIFFHSGAGDRERVALSMRGAIRLMDLETISRGAQDMYAYIQKYKTASGILIKCDVVNGPLGVI